MGSTGAPQQLGALGLHTALRMIRPSELEGFDPAERRGLDPNQTFTELRVLDSIG